MTELEFIQSTLEELAAYVRGKYAERDQVGVQSKAKSTDLMTEVDVAVQQRAMALVAEEFPGDLFVAEEEGMGARPDEPDRRCWIVDPIDGTQNFVRGLYPTFGISVAFAVGGEVAAGGISLPIQDDLFLAERGAGAFRNGERIRVSDAASVEQAWIEVDLGGAAGRKPILDVTARLMDIAGAVRCQCACVVGMCSVAAGELDGYVHYGMYPWDFAAAKLIVEEAGGKVTDFSGAPVTLFDPHYGLVGSNGVFHEEFLATLDA